MNWLVGKKRGLCAYLVIATLVVGGLGWATLAALRLEDDQARLEQERRQAAAEAEAQAAVTKKVQLAMWRLDSLIRKDLAKEGSRPYNHYTAIFAPSIVLGNDGNAAEPGTVLEPSPLLSADLPPWMLLHFQTDEESGWCSPQVLNKELTQRLEEPRVALTNVTPERARLLEELQDHLPPEILPVLVQLRDHQPSQMDLALLFNRNLDNDPSNLKQGLGQSQQSAYGNPAEYAMRGSRGGDVEAKTSRDNWDVAIGNTARNGIGWFNSKRKVRNEPIEVVLGPMLPLWLKTEERGEWLVVARLVRIGKKEVCQGIVLDWPLLQSILAQEIGDLLPAAEFLPMRDQAPEHPERAMTSLPIELDPGPVEVTNVAVPAPASTWRWTTLRLGLALSWAAALVALLAVGLGGWSLIDLSERRIRFVSAVTHELRSPLTTLRLYLDMLTGGMVQDEQQRTEYLQTLHSETERLNRLVGNVLDFSRLENHRPRLSRADVPVGELLEQLRSTWANRCESAGKTLVIENALAEDTMLHTDKDLVQQIVGNLIDNACKYSRDAKDPNLWVRAGSSANRFFVEVEDRGPGISARDRRVIFHAFRRGRSADVTAGGVGLGLALALRWAKLLGGSLTLRSGAPAGACFRLELPA